MTRKIKNLAKGPTIKNDTGETIDLSDVGVLTTVKVEDGIAKASVTGMTIKDIARHKDVVKLEKRLSALEDILFRYDEATGKHYVKTDDGEIELSNPNEVK